MHLTRTTTDVAEAEGWFGQFEGAGLDGVVAKPLAAPYQPNVRTMLKIKHERTADVVVAGYRLHKTSSEEQPLLGSLLLGLYDERGSLQHVGVCAAFTAKRRAELVEELAPLVVPPSEHPWGAWAEAEHHSVTGDRLPGAQSRWSAGKDLSFVALDPRAGARGRLRPHGGDPVPAHRPVQALAHRSRPRVVRLRAARGAGELRLG